MAEEIIFTVNDTQETVSLFVYAGSAAGVDSFNARTGVVIPTIGDYTTAQVTEDTNLYYTDDRVEANGVVVSNTSKITTSRFEARCLGQAVNGRIDNYTSALANIALKESTASLLFDAKICGVGDEKLFNLLPFDIYKDFTVARNGTATYIGSDGFRKTALANVPRIDYTDSVSPALLVEPQATNLLTYSEDFSEYTIGGDGVIDSGYSSPDGNNNAYKFSSSSLNAYLHLGFSSSSPETDNRFIYARTVSGTGKVNLLSHNSNGNNLFDITEDWQKFYVDSSNSVGSTNFYAIEFRGTGVTLNDVIIWGGQVETGTVATSYIPTEGSAVTRVADLVTVSPPTGTTSITETINGANQTPITIIPTTYTIPIGNINKISMT